MRWKTYQNRSARREPPLAGATTLVYLTEPVLQIRRQGNQVTLSWTPPGGTLQQANDVIGPWFNLPTATNPFTINANTARKFYRVRLP